MIPYLIALVGGYLIGESMQENETFASGGILDSDVKDNVSDFLVHKTNSEDFDVYIDNSVSPAEVTITSNAYDETEMQDFLAEANQALFDNDGTIEYNSVKGPLPEFLMHVMADGGKVTFQDKVNAVASRLIGTEVPKRLQGDYGKTYNKEEAFLAAKRIIGAQRAKYGESKSKQGKLFNKGGMVTVKTELNHTIEKLSPKQKKVYESRLQRMKADERFESLTDRDMADYVNGWYGEDIVTNMDFSGKQSFDLGMKVLAMYEAQKEPAFWEEELMIAKDGGKTKSYKNMLYSDMVSDLVKEYFPSDTEIEIEKTEYLQNYVCANFSPVQIINNLASRAKSDPTSAALV